MKVTVVSKFGFSCPSCGEFHTPDSKLEAEQAWDLGSAEIFNAGGGGIVFEQPREIMAFKYSDDSEECVGEDEPEYQTAYQCGECETVYLDKDEAKECCR